MRSYGQYCGLARALDRVGSRWTLLVVRELLVSPQRFSELRRAMPGVPSNLLAERLRELVADGVVERREAEDAVVYALTPLGLALEEAVLALVRWGGAFMRARDGEPFHPPWLVVALRALLADARAEQPWAAELRTEGGAVTVRAGPEGVAVGVGPAPDAAAVLSAPPEVLLGLVAGELPLEVAVAAGLEVWGPAGPEVVRWLATRRA